MSVQFVEQVYTRWLIPTPGPYPTGGYHVLLSGLTRAQLRVERHLQSETAPDIIDRWWEALVRLSTYQRALHRLGHRYDYRVPR